MKKFFRLALLLLVSAAMTASANQFNVHGGLYEALVEKLGIYDGYMADDTSQTSPDKSTNIAILFDYSGSNHAQLLIGKQVGKNWEIQHASAKAVYQKGVKPSVALISSENGGFILKYQDEHYVFLPNDQGQYLLTAADIAGTAYSLDKTAGMYHVKNTDQAIKWRAAPIALDDFNITLFPKNVNEALAYNAMYDKLSSLPFSARNREILVQHAGSKTAAVYSAPSEQSYRAAKGKAAVSLESSVGLLGIQGDWALIRYAINNKSDRIGYIQSRRLTSLPPDIALLDDTAFVVLTAANDSYMTLDPINSQSKDGIVSKGETLKVFGLFDPFYAYVESSISGKPARGFVPIKALR
ncbi:MAG: hypothetical protein GX540_04835 [Clostridiales bacterium]|nr:hypothetical protein [Clostridiales bacterium]